MDYWLSLEAVSFFLTLLIVGFNLVDKFIPRDVPSRVDMFHKLCYENPLFKAWADVNLKEISTPSTPPPGT